VVADSDGAPGLVSVEVQSADPDEIESSLVNALQVDARDGVIRGAAWGYTITVKSPEYSGPALKVYVDVQGETPFVAYTPYVFRLGEPAELGETHRLVAEASVLFPGPKKVVKRKATSPRSTVSKKAVSKKAVSKKAVSKKAPAKKAPAKKTRAQKPVARKGTR